MSRDRTWRNHYFTSQLYPHPFTILQNTMLRTLSPTLSPDTWWRKDWQVKMHVFCCNTKIWCWSLCMVVYRWITIHFSKFGLCTVVFNYLVSLKCNDIWLLWPMYVLTCRQMQLCFLLAANGGWPCFGHIQWLCKGMQVLRCSMLSCITKCFCPLSYAKVTFASVKQNDRRRGWEGRSCFYN